MRHSVPRTPFSTSLSGSAREIEIRLRNIFAGPKRRPSLPLMLLAAALCLLCGISPAIQLHTCVKAKIPLPPAQRQQPWEQLGYSLSCHIISSFFHPHNRKSPLRLIQLLYQLTADFVLRLAYYPINIS